MQWTVKLEAASPDDDNRDQGLRDLVQLLGDEVSVASMNVDGWTLRLEIEAPDPNEALSFANVRVRAAADLVDLPQWPIIAVEVLDAEYASALARDPALPK